MEEYMNDILRFLKTASDEQLQEARDFVSEYKYGPLAEDFIKGFSIDDVQSCDYIEPYSFECGERGETFSDNYNFDKAA